MTQRAAALCPPPPSLFLLPPTPPNFYYPPSPSDVFFSYPKKNVGKTVDYNIASAIKGLCFEPEERTARFKRYRLLLVHVAGRMNRNNCVLGLRLCAPPETVARIAKVWELFPLPTQATCATPLGRGG